MIYSVTGWYWLVGSNTATVWSSSAVAYVSATSGAYPAWVAAGGVATVIASEAELFSVLAAAGVPTGSLGTVQQQAVALLTGSTVAVTSTSTASLNGIYPISPTVAGDLAALATMAANGLPLPSNPLPYPDASGADHSFTQAQFLAFAGAICGYAYALNRCAQGKLASLPSPALTIA